MFLCRIPQPIRIARPTLATTSLYGSTRSSSLSLLSSVHSRDRDSNNNHPLASARAAISVSARYASSNQPTVVQTDSKNFATSSLEPTSIRDVEAALETAFVEKRYELIDSYVNKLVDLYRSQSALRFTFFHTILRKAEHLLDPTVLNILQLLRSSPFEANRLDPRTLQYVYTQKGRDESIRIVLADIMKMQIQDLQIPSGAAALQYDPPTIVTTAFTTLQSLIVEDIQLALDLFNVLVERGFIPSHALEDSSLMESNEVSMVMFYALAMASLHWEWPTLATNAITNLLKTQSARHHLIPQLVNDVVTSLLDDETAAACTTNLQAFLDIIRLHRVPDNAVRRFYEVARSVGAGGEAIKLYGFTRSKLVAGQLPYPPPRGHALGWLMECLCQRKDYRLCGRLVKEVIHDNLTVYTAYRPAFIRGALLSRNANEVMLDAAKVLWYRFTSGEDGHAVYGDVRLAYTLVKKVKAFLKKSSERVTTPGEESELSTETIAGWRSFQRHILRGLSRHWNRRADKTVADAPLPTLFLYIELLFTLQEYKLGFEYTDIFLQRGPPPATLRRYMNTLLDIVSADSATMATKFAKKYINGRFFIHPEITTKILDKAREEGNFEFVNAALKGIWQVRSPPRRTRERM